MENQNFVNFKKVRGLGDMLSDTFKFLGAEWQPFFITIVKLAIVPVLIAIAVAIYFLTQTIDFYAGILSLSDIESGGLEDINFNFLTILVPFLAFGFSYLIAYALVTLVSLSFIKSYIKNRGVVNYEEVQIDVKQKFWSNVGLFLLILIIVFIGTLFCFLPGIYFWVVLSLSVPILIFENRGALDSFSDAFNFIKDNWWETFGILLVVQIIIAVVSYIIDLPASKYLESSLLLFSENQDSSVFTNLFTDPLYLLFIIFSSLAKFVLYILSTIVTVFIYYDIKEQKDPTSDDIIDEIGIS